MCTQVRVLIRIRTCARNLVRRTHDVVAVVFDADVVIARYQRRVPDLVALLDLGTVHGDLAGSVHGDAQRPATRVAGVDDEIGLLSSLDLLQAVSVSVQCRRISVYLTDLDAVRAARYVHPVEFQVDLVDSVLRRHKPHRVRVRVDALDETIVLDTARRHDLKGVTNRLMRLGRSTFSWTFPSERYDIDFQVIRRV